MTTSALTLSDFLLARIAEDEAAARAASPGRWWVHDEVRGDMVVFTAPMWSVEAKYVANVESDNREGVRSPAFDLDLADATHIARHDPARVLVECEAKRAIVECHEDAWGSNLYTEWGRHMQGGTRSALQQLALPYSDHPGYDEAWRP